ncbi:MAG: hypothetical protein ABJA37_11460, partial [Ferruginibacter sp.]
MQINFNQVEDFLNDDSFVSWVYKTDEKHIGDWDSWIAANPAKQALVGEAAMLLRNLQIKESPVTDEQLAAAETRLSNAIAAERENKTSVIINI